MLTGLAAALLVAPCAAFAGGAAASNPEMKRIYDADQGDRQVKPGAVDWKTVGPRDAARRARTHQLLAEGRLHTGADFVEAAYIYQHGDTPDDFLMAHTLAVIALKKGGDDRAPYIAAASLDRYLQRIEQKQIYGTQSNSRDGEAWTREPYNRDLVSDALRRELAVPDLATQDADLAKMNAQLRSGPTKPVATEPARRAAKCDAGPLDKVFLKATWHVFACDDGALLVKNDGESPAVVFVYIFNGNVAAATADGIPDSEEIVAVKSAFAAMSPAQVTDLVAEARAVKPVS